MALPASGAISLSDFNTELGNAAGTTISMNDADVRALLGLSAGAEASFSDYYGASSVVDIALTIAANTNNYNIFTNKGGSYVAGKSNVTLTINSGVTVGSTSTGTQALDTGTGWASGDAITIINNGIVKGRGGNGGDGADITNNNTGFLVSSVAAGAGGAGGSAFRAQFATSITNNGTFAGAGGGGGGGGATRYRVDDKFGLSFNVVSGGGGGGGAGTNAGSGGAFGVGSGFYKVASGTATAKTTNSNAGSSGTATSGGAGGEGVFNNSTEAPSPGTSGGAGGGLGSAGTAGSAGNFSHTTEENGGAGGASGNYAVGNSNITWTVTGTRQGGVS